MPSPRFQHKFKPAWRQRGKRPKTSRLKIVLAGLATLLIGLIFIFAAGAIFSRELPDPNKLIERDVPETTKIYDRTGENLLYEVHGEQRRTLIKLKDAPDYLQKATITIEDRDFYSHKGFDLKGIVRAIIVDIFTGSARQGGSTITQQFIKNAILTRQKSIIRKIKELVLSYRLEKKFSKDEILQFYLNEIPYGSTIYGVESASQAFFGKSVKDLTLAQSALLAAIPKAPTYYSPYGNHRDELLSRKNFILKEMAELDYVTKDEAEKAMLEKLEFKPRREEILAPHFVIYVKELLSQKYGETVVEQGGLRVTTTLDLKLQQAAEKAIEDNVKNLENFGASNAALVAIDPKTGDILAMVGSRDYFNEEIDGNVNVTLRPRQPGSSFKPIVYATAFMNGYTPNTVLYDVVTTFKTETGKKYTPHNYDGKEHGPVTMAKALAGSLNIPAVKTIYLTGISNVLDLAQKLGYTTFRDRSRFGLSLVLGGGEVRLIEHTKAFSAFANEGTVPKLKTVLKVEGPDGEILEEDKDSELEDAMAQETARRINGILSNNSLRAFIFGEKNYLAIPGVDVAAKTGTTNDYRDAWTIGYTPSLVAGVWVGNNDNSAMKRSADGSKVAAPIWNNFMRKALEGRPLEKFNSPKEMKTGNPALDGEIGKITVKIDKISGKLATELTPPDLIEEKTYFAPHSLLYYVRPDDPQLKLWEEAVQKWAQKNKLSVSEPPKDEDDIHTEKNKPELLFLSPEENQILRGSSLKVLIEAKAQRGIAKIGLLLDNMPVTTLFAPPYSYELFIAQVSEGAHQISAIASDDVQNANKIYRTFYIER